MRCATYHLVLAVVLVAGGVTGCEDAPPPGSASPANPEELRILSLTPNVTEILFALGLGDKIVGRSTHCLWPPEAESIPAVGDTLRLNLEKIVSLKPNLAFAVTKKEEVKRTLEGMDIPTVLLESDTMAELMEAIDTVGRRTGMPGAALSLRDQIREDLEKVRRRVASRQKPKVLFAFPTAIGSPKMMVAGRGTFVDELLQVAGAENAYREVADWPTVTVQQVIAMAPQVVLINAVGDDAAPDRLEAIRKAWDQWSSVPAVAGGRVVVLRERYLTIPGPSIALAAKRLAEAIHPDLEGQ